MRMLIVGAGALGGVIATRLRASGSAVSLAVRNTATAKALRLAGLNVSGVGGPATADVDEIATIEQYAHREPFDLIVLATKANDAMDAAPRLIGLLARGGTLLPLQNGVVSEVLAERLGHDHVLGSLSNLGALMISPGVYEQRNAGHLLIGEIGAGLPGRVELVRQHLAGAVDVRVTSNLRGALWSKLLINCAGTTVAAIAGSTIRELLGSPDGRQLFRLAYDEVLNVAHADGVTLERMIVDPWPPQDDSYDSWLQAVVESYGDIKPSMLQDFERGRLTEIDFLNGSAVERARDAGLQVPANAAIVEIVHAITRGELRPDPEHVARILTEGH